jgi:methyl-accepting chemotaxis protein
MSDEDVSVTSRTAAALERLQTSAKHFQPVTSALSRSVQQVEQILAVLNLRVACWTEISESVLNGGHTTYSEYVGYIEHGNRWQIVLSTDKRGYDDPEPYDEKIWSFNEAPQYLRIKAVDKLPALIDSLAATVDKTAERMAKKLDAAQEIATAIAEFSKKKKVTR